MFGGGCSSILGGVDSVDEGELSLSEVVEAEESEKEGWCSGMGGCCWISIINWCGLVSCSEYGGIGTVVEPCRLFVGLRTTGRLWAG